MKTEKTPIETAIAEFEKLKDKAENLRDVIYLDAVMAVLDGQLNYEKKYIEKAIKKAMKEHNFFVNKANKIKSL